MGPSIPAITGIEMRSRAKADEVDFATKWWNDYPNRFVLALQKHFFKQPQIDHRFWMLRNQAGLAPSVYNDVLQCFWNNLCCLISLRYFLCRIIDNCYTYPRRYTNLTRAQNTFDSYVTDVWSKPKRLARSASYTNLTYIKVSEPSTDFEKFAFIEG